LDKLLSVSYTTQLSILGGEPLLHPKLSRFFELFSQMKYLKNIEFIKINTNGTTVPSDEVFMRINKIENMGITISNYGEKSSKTDELAEKCKQFDVPFFIEYSSTKWTDFGEFSHSRNYSDNELRHLYAACHTTMCNPLYDGKLYSCARLAVLNEEKLIPYDSKAFLDVRNTQEDILSESVHKYLYGTKFFQGCQYCNGDYPYSKKVLRGI
jgi:organic radical activating enzyme